MFWIIGGGTVFSALANVWPNPVTFTIRRQFGHVQWEGFHFEDLIYPLFLTLIGVVLPFSLSRRSAQAESLARQYLHFLKRSMLLIILGSIPGGLFSFTHWPYLGGVLAHIGLCYLPAALLVRHARWQMRTGLVGGYLVVYWLASLLIPVPGVGAGVFTEDGSLASYIDHHLISGKLWNEGPSPRSLPGSWSFSVARWPGSGCGQGVRATGKQPAWRWPDWPGWYSDSCGVVPSQ